MFSRFKKPEAGPAKPSMVPVGAAQAAPKATTQTVVKAPSATAPKVPVAKTPAEDKG